MRANAEAVKAEKKNNHGELSVEQQPATRATDERMRACRSSPSRPGHQRQLANCKLIYLTTFLAGGSDGQTNEKQKLGMGMGPSLTAH